MKDLKWLFYFEDLLQTANNELIGKAKVKGDVCPMPEAECGISIDELWEFCEQLHADMVIMWEHMSCKALDGMHGQFEEQARERTARSLEKSRKNGRRRTVSGAPFFLRGKGAKSLLFASFFCMIYSVSECAFTMPSGGAENPAKKTFFHTPKSAIRRLFHETQKA